MILSSKVLLAEAIIEKSSVKLGQSIQHNYFYNLYCILLTGDAYIYVTANLRNQ